MSRGWLLENVVPRFMLICVDGSLFCCDLVLTTQESPMYFRKKTSGGRAYLQIVESRRDGGQVRQQVIATLGRYEDLRESGQLERLLRSGRGFPVKRWWSTPSMTGVQRYRKCGGLGQL